MTSMGGSLNSRFQHYEHFQPWCYKHLDNMSELEPQCWFARLTEGTGRVMPELRGPRGLSAPVESGPLVVAQCGTWSKCLEASNFGTSTNCLPPPSKFYHRHLLREGIWWSSRGSVLWTPWRPLGVRSLVLGCSPFRLDQEGHAWAPRAEKTVTC